MMILFIVFFILFVDTLGFIIPSNQLNRKLMHNTILYGGKVALTREAGKNEKLRLLLDSAVETIELPCIMFADGNDLIRLEAEMKLHDLVVITSPQSANVFIRKWLEGGSPNIKVATVGQGTSKPLIDAGINVVFEPSDNTAKILAQELPQKWGTTVLYPTSNLADATLQNELESRGFVVTRIESYATVPSVWSVNELNIAKTDIDSTKPKLSGPIYLT